MMPGSTALHCETLQLFVQEEMVMLLVLKGWGKWGKLINKREIILKTMPSELRCCGEVFRNRADDSMPSKLVYKVKCF